MKLADLFKKAIATGVANDPRGKDAVQKALDAKKKEYEDLKGDEKEFFDAESLENPYSDSRLLHGTGEEEIASAMVGIDLEVGEMLVAEALRARGKKVDLLIAHHPEGRAYANLYGVMNMQSDILGRFGVPINVAEDLMEKRIKDVERRLMPVNHTRAVDAAKLLDIPYICLHTPADNMVVTYLQRLFDDKKPYDLSDILDLLRKIPEYRVAMGHGAGPKILIGSKQRKAGRIFVDMTGGTEGSKEIFASLATSGVSTIVAMHLSDDHRKEAEKSHMNVVIAGHISSDNVGLNLLFDEIMKDSPVELIECSGYRRVSRL